jgi:hypothetical protein
MNQGNSEQVYMRLSVDAKAFHSGSTYHEEVFLPAQVWDEIKSDFGMTLGIPGLDGKHSMIHVDINTKTFSSGDLETYVKKGNDDDELLYHIYEYLPAEKYDRDYLGDIQEDVSALFKAEVIQIKIHKDKKEEVMALLKDYLL